VPDEIVRLDHRLSGIEQRGDGGVRLVFANGATVTADLAIAADGVNSAVKDALFGKDEPNFTGRIAYRAVFPADRLGGHDIGDCTKWWGEDRHIVMYPVKPDRSEVYFVTSQPEPGFNIESWSAEGDVAKARLLLDHGAAIDAIDDEYCSTPLGVAARWGRRDIVTLLLARGADPNASGAPWSTPLAWARKKGHADVEAALRAAGATA